MIYFQFNLTASKLIAMSLFQTYVAFFLCCFFLLNLNLNLNLMSWPCLTSLGGAQRVTLDVIETQNNAIIWLFPGLIIVKHEAFLVFLDFSRSLFLFFSFLITNSTCRYRILLPDASVAGNGRQPLISPPHCATYRLATFETDPFKILTRPAIPHLFGCSLRHIASSLVKLFLPFFY